MKRKMTLSAKCSPHKHEVLCFIPRTHIKLPGMVVFLYICLCVCMIHQKTVLRLMGAIKGTLSTVSTVKSGSKSKQGDLRNGDAANSCD